MLGTTDVTEIDSLSVLFFFLKISVSPQRSDYQPGLIHNCFVCVIDEVLEDQESLQCGQEVDRTLWAVEALEQGEGG